MEVESDVKEKTEEDAGAAADKPSKKSKVKVEEISEINNKEPEEHIGSASGTSGLVAPESTDAEAGLSEAREGDTKADLHTLLNKSESPNNSDPKQTEPEAGGSERKRRKRKSGWDQGTSTSTITTASTTTATSSPTISALLPHAAIQNIQLSQATQATLLQQQIVAKQVFHEL